MKRMQVIARKQSEARVRVKERCICGGECAIVANSEGDFVLSCENGCDVCVVVRA